MEALLWMTFTVLIRYFSRFPQWRTCRTWVAARLKNKTSHWRCVVKCVWNVWGKCENRIINAWHCVKPVTLSAYFASWNWRSYLTKLKKISADLNLLIKCCEMKWNEYLLEMRFDYLYTLLSLTPGIWK